MKGLTRFGFLAAGENPEPLCLFLLPPDWSVFGLSHPKCLAKTPSTSFHEAFAVNPAAFFFFPPLVLFPPLEPTLTLALTWLMVLGKIEFYLANQTK